MLSLENWTSLYQGKYGNQELTILYKEDTFVSLLKLREQNNVLVEIYKAFSATGDLESFITNLPYPTILYQKHFSVGDNGNYKYILLNTNTEYVDTEKVSDFVDNKISELNKRVGSIISMVKSYNVKLMSLKLSTDDAKNYFFSDPFAAKLLTNMPLSFDLSRTTMDKLILGKKNDVLITTSIDSIRSVGVFSGTVDERAFCQKIICENYLLSSRQVFIFDNTGLFKSLGSPQDDKNVLFDYDLKMDPFAFPVKTIDYFEIKIPLSVIPLSAFITIFGFSDIAKKIIAPVYSKDIIKVSDLIKRIEVIEVAGDVTEFEKKRVLAKLEVIDNNLGKQFGVSDFSLLFEQRYKNIGSVKIMTINANDKLYPYYAYYLINEISSMVKDDVLIGLPESNNLFNNIYVGRDVFAKLRENAKVCYLVSGRNKTDFKIDRMFAVEIDMITDNDGVINYPGRDPLRLLFRPTLTSSNINYRKVKSVSD